MPASKNCVIAAKLENGLTGGSAGVITVPAHVGGAIPVGAATVTTPGTGYPANRTIEVHLTIAANSTALGRITTSVAGAITAIEVLDGGSGYVHAVPTVATMAATPNGSYGVQTNPNVSTDAILVGTDFKLDPNIIMVERDVYTGSMGGKQTIPGEGSVNLSFTVELAGSGAAVTEAAWALLLKCAGAAAALTAATKWDYTPLTDLFPSMTMRVWRGGWQHTIIGCRVSKIDFDFTVSDKPQATFNIIGIERSRIVANLPNPTLTAWKTPIVITDANTGDLRFGTTASPIVYTPATGAITGGVAYGSKGLKLTWDNKAKFRPFLGGSGVPITDREITGSFMLDLNGTDNVAFYNAFKANTTTQMSFQIGTAAGAILKLFMPAVERNAPGDEDDDGILLSSYNIRARPTGYGLNDEIRFVTM